MLSVFLRCATRQICCKMARLLLHPTERDLLVCCWKPSVCFLPLLGKDQHKCIDIGPVWGIGQVRVRVRVSTLYSSLLCFWSFSYRSATVLRAG